MRPLQWSKNLLIFAAPIFSLTLLNKPEAITNLLLFIAFCLAASAVYLMNDVFDQKRDALHPIKRYRPLASGALNKITVINASIITALISLTITLFLSTTITVIIVIYFMLNILYNTIFKKIFIIDILIITSGYLLRVMAGAIAINVEISHWLLLCTFLLALFLILAKRRSERILLKKRPHIRPVSSKYTLHFLHRANFITAGLTILSYTFYTIAPQTIRKFGSIQLLYTLPFVIFGIMRYLYIGVHKAKGGNPERLLLTDIWLIITILGWLLTVFIILYYI